MSESITIGRHGAEQQEATISVDDEYVSTVHAKITKDDSGRVTVEDMGSTNGTYVNGLRIYASPLRPGDRLRVGRTEVIVPPSLWR